MRYTESRLTRIAGEMLADIDSDTVDFVPNYDESTTEPTVLPARIPNLIVNGSTGIAVGMATNIPPHNLTEVLNATIALLTKDKAETRSDLDLVLEHVKGPTSPPAASSTADQHPPAYKTGRGRFMMRAKCGHRKHLRRPPGHHRHRDPLPGQQVQAHQAHRRARQRGIIDDISDVRDESDRDGMRIVIGLKRGAQHQIVLNQLYKHTQMQEASP
jgi:DNA gyrase subunit A